MSSEKQNENSENKPEKPLPIKKCADLQRLKLEKLMKNFDKPIVIPPRPKEKTLSHVPEFIRNVMGSSAGAGSGEFHVYRHLRRKEYARQKFIQLKSEKEMLDEAYKKKLEENARIAEERTAKKRAKRLKKKEKLKNRKKKPRIENKVEEESESSSPDDDETENKETEDKETENKEINDKTGKKETEKTENSDAVDSAETQIQSEKS